MSTRNPALFVVGCPRSGTTLLQRMLDHHPQLVVTNDTHFIPRGHDGFAVDDIELTPELVDRVVTYRRFPRLGLPEDAARRLGSGVNTYRDFVSALYDEVALMHGKPLAGEKTPDYVRHLPLLSRLFPWAPFLHILRDGRDVALSVVDWARDGKGPSKLPLWDEDPLGTATLWWRWQVGTGRRDASSLSDIRYLEVRYESLAAEPEPVLRSVATFLGLEYTSAMVAFHKGRTIDDPNLSAKKAWLPATPGLRDWRDALTVEELLWFEALAGDLLSELGYERAFPHIPKQEKSRAERFEREFEAQIRRRRSAPVLNRPSREA
ncbi:MAG TPA: sulfotransferase [Acidimicrobiia bacterium]